MSGPEQHSGASTGHEKRIRDLERQVKHLQQLVQFIKTQAPPTPVDYSKELTDLHDKLSKPFIATHSRNPGQSLYYTLNNDVILYSPDGPYKLLLAMWEKSDD